LTGLSFLVSTQELKEALFFSKKKFNSQYTPQEILTIIKKEIDANEALKECKEVSIVYANTTYTMVPDALFNKDKLSEYLKFNSKILSGDYLAYDTIVSKKLHLVYVPFININNYLFETFGSFQYYHAATILLQYLLEKQPNTFATRAYIQVHDDHFDLVILKDGTLLLCNSYSYKTPEDLAYYVLFALEQLALAPNTIETKVLGNIEETDSNFAMLYTYIRNVSILDVTDGLTITELRPHQQIAIRNCF
jgi:hypothetical protein